MSASVLTTPEGAKMREKVEVATGSAKEARCAGMKDGSADSHGAMSGAVVSTKAEITQKDQTGTPKTADSTQRNETVESTACSSNDIKVEHDVVENRDRGATASKSPPNGSTLSKERKEYVSSDSEEKEDNAENAVSENATQRVFGHLSRQENDNDAERPPQQSDKLTSHQRAASWVFRKRAPLSDITNWMDKDGRVNLTQRLEENFDELIGMEVRLERAVVSQRMDRSSSIVFAGTRRSTSTTRSIQTSTHSRSLLTSTSSNTPLAAIPMRRAKSVPLPHKRASEDELDAIIQDILHTSRSVLTPPSSVSPKRRKMIV